MWSIIDSSPNSFWLSSSYWTFSCPKMTSPYPQGLYLTGSGWSGPFNQQKKAFKCQLNLFSIVKIYFQHLHGEWKIIYASNRFDFNLRLYIGQIKAQPVCFCFNCLNCNLENTVYRSITFDFSMSKTFQHICSDKFIYAFKLFYVKWRCFNLMTFNSLSPFHQLKYLWKVNPIHDSFQPAKNWFEHPHYDCTVIYASGWIVVTHWCYIWQLQVSSLLSSCEIALKGQCDQY